MARIKVTGLGEYEIPTDLTLGEMRTLKRFGVTDFSDVSAEDPDVLAGMLFIAMRRVNPAVTEDTIDKIPATAFDFVDDETPEEAGPPPVAANGNAPAASASEKTPAVSGSPS